MRNGRRSRAGIPLCAGLLAGFSALASPASVLANGRFPASSHVIEDPGDPAHVLIRATYGVVFTRTGGSRWEWNCEEGIGYTGIWDPPVAIAAGGTVIAGLPDGLRLAPADSCDWLDAAGIAGQFVTDVSAGRQDPSRALALTAMPAGGGTESAVWESSSDAMTFLELGTKLPGDFRALTLDAAPSAPETIYVSGLQGTMTGMPTGVIARSTDGAMTWIVYPIPGSDDAHSPFLGAIDPFDPARIYVRLAGEPGTLLVSIDGGEHFTELFSGTGPLKAFALSPDGSALLTGGEKDGIWRSPTAMPAFEKVSNVRAGCLAWTAAGVYVCGEEFTDGFSVGFSVTSGSTFAPWMNLRDLCGPPSCGPGTSVGLSCPSRWPVLKASFGAISCDDPDAGTSGDTLPGPSDPGCSCRTARDRKNLPGALGAFGLAVCLLLSRKKW